MKYIILILFALIISSCIRIVTEDQMIELAEVAYFEGQRDAISGDVRIKLGSDSVYYWAKSPWDCNYRRVTFNPTYLDSKNRKCE